MNPHQNKMTMQAAFDDLAAGDPALFLASMADDFSWTIAGVATEWADTWSGKQAVRDQLLTPLFEQFEDGYTNTALSFTAEEDRVVIECRGRVATKAGARYDNQYCYVCRFDESGRMVSLVEYADTALMDKALQRPPRRSGSAAEGA